MRLLGRKTRVMIEGRPLRGLLRNDRSADGLREDKDSLTGRNGRFSMRCIFTSLLREGRSAIGLREDRDRLTGRWARFSER